MYQFLFIDKVRTVSINIMDKQNKLYVLFSISFASLSLFKESINLLTGGKQFKVCDDQRELLTYSRFICNNLERFIVRF